MSIKKYAVISFTERGARARERVVAALGDGAHADIYEKGAQDLKAWVRERFFTADALVFICAAGIAVRLIAPLISSKDRDPAVIAMDEGCRHVIPLLSGHIGGANALAVRLADALGADAAVTTATDLNGVFAADAWAAEHGCAVGDISSIKHISSALLGGKTVGFYSDFPVSGPLPRGLAASNGGAAGVCVSLDGGKRPFETCLNLIPRIVTVGAGCRRGADATLFEEFVLSVLEDRHVSRKAVRAVASIDLKADEECIIKFARKYELDFVTYAANELRGAAYKGDDGADFSGSRFVAEVTGVDNVCERAAVMRGGGLIIRKTARDGMTFAAAAEDWRCEFDEDM